MLVQEYSTYKIHVHWCYRHTKVLRNRTFQCGLQVYFKHSWKRPADHIYQKSVKLGQLYCYHKNIFVLFCFLFFCFVLFCFVLLFVCFFFLQTPCYHRILPKCTRACHVTHLLTAHWPMVVFYCNSWLTVDWWWHLNTTTTIILLLLHKHLFQ